jgi:hypothetical protein
MEITKENSQASKPEFYTIHCELMKNSTLWITTDKEIKNKFLISLSIGGSDLLRPEDDNCKIDRGPGGDPLTVTIKNFKSFLEFWHTNVESNRKMQEFVNTLKLHPAKNSTVNWTVGICGDDLVFTFDGGTTKELEDSLPCYFSSEDFVVKTNDTLLKELWVYVRDIKIFGTHNDRPFENTSYTKLFKCQLPARILYVYCQPENGGVKLFKENDDEIKIPEAMKKAQYNETNYYVIEKGTRIRFDWAIEGKDINEVAVYLGEKVVTRDHSVVYITQPGEYILKADNGFCDRVTIKVFITKWKSLINDNKEDKDVDLSFKIHKDEFYKKRGQKIFYHKSFGRIFQTACESQRFHTIIKGLGINDELQWRVFHRVELERSNSEYLFDYSPKTLSASFLYRKKINSFIGPLEVSCIYSCGSIHPILSKNMDLNIDVNVSNSVPRCNANLLAMTSSSLSINGTLCYYYVVCYEYKNSEQNPNRACLPKFSIFFTHCYAWAIFQKIPEAMKTEYNINNSIDFSSIIPLQRDQKFYLVDTCMWQDNICLGAVVSDGFSAFIKVYSITFDDADRVKKLQKKSILNEQIYGFDINSVSKSYMSLLPTANSLCVVVNNQVYFSHTVDRTEFPPMPIEGTFPILGSSDKQLFGLFPDGKFWYVDV